MEPFVQIHDTYLQIEQWQQVIPHVTAGFSTRYNGVSKEPYDFLNMGFHVGDEEECVKTNREILAAHIGFSLSTWVCTEQVHQAEIQKVSLADAGKGAVTRHTAIQGTDGIYTTDQGLLLTSLYADCVPLYFLSKYDQLIGLAHAGWRGTVLQIGPKMVQKWVEDENVLLKHIQVVIGPCISQEQYEVDEAIILKVNECLADDDSIPYEKIGNNKYLLDLRELNKILLLQAGLSSSQVRVSSICTALDPRMYSFRAENGKTGRMMSFIGMNDKKTANK